jgi:hypothetical protein
MPAPFSDLATLEKRFADGLAAMLEAHHGLGVYILVLANAAYDPALWTHLAAVLEARHSALAQRITDALRQGKNLNEPDDDVLVFLKLLAIGFAHLQPMQQRQTGLWNVLFNPIRALRPPRNSGLTFDTLLRPFNPADFHFNKPFLAREVFWEGELAGKPARLLYNKFPFARLHSLLVPEPLRQHPQMLDPDLHRWAWQVCAQSDIPGFGLGYNSQGAGASVNHLHFQGLVQAMPLPVQDARFSHNGGDLPYPLPVQRVRDPDAAWTQIDLLHQRNIPYNLIYSPRCLHLIARVPQDSARLNAGSRGYGWSEMAGAVTRFSRETYASSCAAEFEADLRSFMP